MMEINPVDFNKVMSQVKTDLVIHQASASLQRTQNKLQQEDNVKEIQKQASAAVDEYNDKKRQALVAVNDYNQHQTNVAMLVDMLGEGTPSATHTLDPGAVVSHIEAEKKLAAYGTIEALKYKSASSGNSASGPFNIRL